MNISPPLLKQGDKIGILAPSRVIYPSQMECALSIFKDWGLQPSIGDHLYSSHGYFAGTDAQRRSDMQAMLDAPDIKAIFCARGGYGMTRIVDSLDFSAIKTSPKWIIGFSDITALHLALNKLRTQSIHGLMPVQYELEGIEWSLESLRELLFSGSFEYTLSADSLNRVGEVEAEVIGGNLSLLADSLGTKTALDTEGKILFIEEIDEYLYKIDRMLTQLKRGGRFEKLRGLLVGEFSDIKDTKIAFGKEVHELINDHFAHFNFPVAYNVPIGHGVNNLAIPCGRKIMLNVKEEGVTISG